MKMFVEMVEEVEFVTESTKTGKNYFVEGVFMQADITNRNGRIYPKKTLNEAVNDYRTNYVDTKRAYGELGHPANPQINPERISHRIVSLKEDGANYIGKAKISDSPYGKIIKNLIDEGGSLGVSSRGLGNIRKGDGAAIVESFRLVTAADVVIDPSAPDAFVQAVMEGVEWIMEAGNWVPRYVEETQKAIHTASKADREQRILESINKFLTRISL